MKDIYGDSIDKILQGNTGNIIYLKSTDDSMLDNLEKISGIRHESYKASKAVSYDAKKILNAAETKVNETTNVEKVPVISKNDMLLIPKSNEMVFGKGNPIWDRNQMALPMAWRLHKKMPHAPGNGGYQLNTVPSSSNTDDFDILGNQPNFYAMVAKRSRQARIAKLVWDQYKKVYNLSEDEMHRIKPDELAKQLMAGINDNLHVEDEAKRMQAKEDAEVDDDEVLDAISQQEYIEDTQQVASNDDDTSVPDNGTSALAQILKDQGTDNTEAKEAELNQSKIQQELKEPRYAEGRLSKADFDVHNLAQAHTSYDADVAIAYSKSIASFGSDSHFRVAADGTLTSGDGSTVYIEVSSNPDTEFGQDSESFKDNATGHVTTLDGSDGPETDEEIAEAKYHPTDEFYKYLGSLPNWDTVANGVFDAEMANILAMDDEQAGE